MSKSLVGEAVVGLIRALTEKVEDSNDTTEFEKMSRDMDRRHARSQERLNKMFEK